jgi:O-antigen/teichoic acid export membrane protein
VQSVAAAEGRGDRGGIRRTLATAFWVYSAISALTLTVALPALAFGHLDTLFHTDGSDTHAVRGILLATVAGLLLNLPLKVTPAGATGLQQQYLVSLYRVVQGPLNLAAVVACALVWRGDLIAIVAIPTAVDLLAALVFFRLTPRLLPDLALQLSAAATSEVRPLLSSSLTFFAINLANLFKMSLGATLVGHALGPELAPALSVPLTVFAFGLTLAELFVAPLWPGFREAATGGDWAWIDRTFAVAVKVALGLAALAAVLGATFGDRLIAAWTRGVSQPPEPLLAALAVWLVASTMVLAATWLVNGLGGPRRVMWVCLGEGVVSFGLALATVHRFGVTGVGASMAVAALGSAVALTAAVGPVSQGRVKLAPADWARLLVPVSIALGCALVERRWLAGQPHLLAVIVGGVSVSAIYLGSAFRLVLRAEERDRLRAVLRRRR